MINKKSRWQRKLISAMMVLAVSIAFIVFLNNNKETIYHQSLNLVKESTIQKADRINEVFKEQVGTIKTTAYLYGKSLDSLEVDLTMLKTLEDNSMFEWVRFVDADGVDYTSGGVIVDCSDRFYYKDGIAGNTGISEPIISRVTGAKLLGFYSPVYYEEEIIGVMVGFLSEDYMKTILQSRFYGYDANVLIASKDGEIIANYGNIKSNGNLQTYFDDNKYLTDDEKQDVKKALEKGQSGTFKFKGDKGDTVGYLTALEMKDWIMIQVFPSRAVEEIENKANMAGLLLEIVLILVFVIYIVWIVFTNRKQKQIMKKTNRDANYVADAISLMFDKFVYVDLETETYEYLQNAVPQFFNIPPKGDYDLLVKHMLAMIVSDDEKDKVRRMLYKENIQDKMDKNNMILSCTYKIKRDIERWEELNIICLGFKNEKVTKIILARQDISIIREEEISNQNTLKQALLSAEEANNFKNEFLSQMSHNIRRPLNAIVGMATIANLNMDDRERVIDCLDKIKGSSVHLSKLIDGIIDMSKVDKSIATLSERRFSICELTDRLLSVMRVQFEDKKQILTIHSSHIVHEELVGDTNRVEQIILNIVSNANKYTPEGGKIDIRIQEKKSSIGGFGCFEIVVEDTGVGMSQETLERIFKPFYKADKKDEEGVGLGLPIAYNIVRMMNGDITIESVQGKGTKVTVVLYLKLSDKEEQEYTKLKGNSILVVDGREHECKIAVEILESIDVEVSYVNSGEEAIEMLEILEKVHSGDRKFDAVIVDMEMSGMNGIETARTINERMGESAPPIIISAYDYSEIEETASAAGVKAFLLKPLYKSRIIKVLETVVLGYNEKELIESVKAQLSGKRALIVEDDVVNAEFMEEVLQSVQIETESVDNGSKAIHKLYESEQGYYDIVFMDVNMPDMNGYEASKAIRNSGIEYLSEIPIIAMTADAYEEDVERAKNAGMNEHLAKPIEMEKVMEYLVKWIK